MTDKIRRKRTAEGAEEIEIPWSKGTLTFRSLLMLLVVSATPMGQQMLKNLGIYAPMTENVGQLHKDVEGMRTDVTGLKADILGIKADMKAMGDKNQILEMKVTGFLVDFDKYRKQKQEGNPDGCY